jgi:hypothetical protein
MPDVFLASVAPGALFRRAVAGRTLSPGGAVAPRVFRGSANFQGARVGTSVRVSPVARAPLLRRLGGTAPFFTPPLLPRLPGARRTGGLIWPRQFAGTRPDAGLLVPRLRGVAVPEPGTGTGVAGALVWDDGRALVWDDGRALVFN